MDLDYFVDLIPKVRLQPRTYTCASSSRVEPDLLRLCITVHEDFPRHGRRHKGLCTNWLKRLPAGSAVTCAVQPSTFRLPEDPSTPLIMVAAGSGIAPFRAFLAERVPELAGPALLFYGCRTRDQVLYRELLERACELSVFLSREPSEPRAYAQEGVRTHADRVAELVAAGAFVYVCGSTGLGDGVAAALADVLGPEVLQQLEDDGRYIAELWS